MINLNDMAQKVSEKDKAHGKHNKNLNISDVSEIQSHVLNELSQYSDEEIIELMNNRRGK